MTPRPPSNQLIPEHAKKVFSGILFDVYQWEQELYDGSTTTFEKLKRRDSVVMVPVLPSGNLLVEEDTQPGRNPVLTFPGGQAEGGEDPKEAGLRELLEETGYTSDDVVLWKAVQPASKIDWSIFIFVARNAQKVSEPLDQAGEKIETREVSLDELYDVVLDPRFQNKEIQLEVALSRYDEEKREALKKLLYG